VRRVSAAVDDGRLDIEEGGQVPAAILRARTRSELDVLLHDLVPGEAARSGPDERPSAAGDVVRVLLLAAPAALMLFLLLHGLDPAWCFSSAAHGVVARVPS